MASFLSPQPARTFSSGQRSPTDSQIVASATDGSATSLFTAHDDGTVRQWRAEGPNTWVETRTHRTAHAPGSLHKLAVAPSFALPPGTFATGGLDGTAQVHDGARPPAPALSSSLRPPASEPGECRVLALAFAPDQPVLAVLYPAEVRLFARAPMPHAEWRLQRCVPLPAATGAALSFAPGGKYLFAAGVVLARAASPWAWQEVAALPGVQSHAVPDRDSDPFATSVSNTGTPGDASFGTLVSAHWAATGFLAVSREVPTGRKLPFDTPSDSTSGSVEVYRLRNGTFSRVAAIETKAVVSALEWDRTGTVFAGVAESTLYKFGRTLREGEWVWAVRDQTSLSAGAA